MCSTDVLFAVSAFGLWLCPLMVHTPYSASSCLRQQPRIMKKLFVQDLFYLFLKSHTPNNCNRTLTCKLEVVIVGDLHVGQLEPLLFSSLWLEKLGSWSFGCAVSPVPFLASQGKTPCLELPLVPLWVDCHPDCKCIIG